MCITGFLADFSLPEICRLLDKGHHTGLLTIHTNGSTQGSPRSIYYIWVYRGRIVSITNPLNHRGLVELITKRQWCNKKHLAKLVELCPSHQPFGSYLKQQGVLTTKHLKWLFQRQVLQPMYALFQLKAGQFRFDHNVQLPMQDMTGLSLGATVVTLIGLRSLSNWDALTDKLPDLTGGLVSIITGPPRYPLDTLESQVWEYTNGTVSLETIAQQLRLPAQKVQQIAFRLIAIGLAEEVPLVINSPSPQPLRSLPTQFYPEAKNHNVSHSFLQNLVGFLVTKSKKQSVGVA